MAQPPRPDVLSEVDHILAQAPVTVPPWRRPVGSADEHAREYVPDYATLRDLLAVPIGQGHAQSQQSGRVAKSLDAYIAYELRRAGVPASDVFPRARIPRVLSPDMAPVEAAIENLLGELASYENASAQRLKPAALRQAIVRLARVKPGGSETNV